MKKSIFAIGLLSLVMILTSFTTPQTTKTKETAKTTVSINTTLQANGSNGAGPGVKID